MNAPRALRSSCDPGKHLQRLGLLRALLSYIYTDSKALVTGKLFTESKLTWASHRMARWIRIASTRADLRHHPALEHIEGAADAGRVPALIDVAHAAGEALWLPLVRDLLDEAFPQLSCVISMYRIDCLISQLCQ